MRRRLIFEVCANCGKKIVDDEKAVLLDRNNDLIFCDEYCLNEHFEQEVEKLQRELESLRSSTDIQPAEYSKYEQFLQPLLSEPEEVWELDDLEENSPAMSFYMGEFIHEKEPVFYIAAVYLSDEKPAFVYIHFPTRDIKLVEKYRRGELVYDSSEQDEADELEEEAVTEDNVAANLYSEMLQNHSESDIDIEDFPSYAELRLPTLDEPLEIWKFIDDLGNTFVVYWAYHPRDPDPVAYVVVTVEDELTDGVIPVFSFPTTDQKLLDRFRRGEIVYKADSEDF